MTMIKGITGSAVLLAALSLRYRPQSRLRWVPKLIPRARCSAISFCRYSKSRRQKTVNKSTAWHHACRARCHHFRRAGYLPEYTGNGAFFFKDENDPARKNAKARFEKVKKLDAEKISWSG